MITEDYVSFETAKLLKEKGFDKDIVRVVNEEGEIDYLGSFKTDLSYRYHTWYKCPTLQMTVKWLRETYNIDISVVPHSHKEGKTFDYEFVYWNGEEYHTPYNEKYPTYHKLFGKTWKKHEEACEAAIKYCLENLIKNKNEEEKSNIPVPKTIDEAISTLEKILSDEDREYLLKNGAISMHDSLGRWIRNEWGLWTGSELKDELLNMNKGLNHPDDMSNYIIEEFIKYWNNKL